MLRTFAVILAVACSAAVADAQSVRVTPLIGGTEPRAGSLVMYVPVPVMVGFDSTPQRYTYDEGRAYGALLEWDRASWLDFAALATVNQATRGFATLSGFGDCDACESTIVGLGLLASTRVALGGRIELSLAAGPEALFFSGDAVSTEGTAPPPTEVSISPTFAVGGMGTAGLSLRTRPGQALRLLLAYRAFAPKYEGAGTTSFTAEPIRQLMWTVGYSFTLSGAR
jgi:hypothetical protein